MTSPSPPAADAAPGPAPRHPVIEDPSLPSSAPAVTPDTRELWDATLEGRLLVRRCQSCGRAFWYPRPLCPFCHSRDTAWEEATGEGVIYSFTVVRRGAGPWAAVAPFVLAYVELREGPRMMTNIVDCDPAAVEVGRAVTVVFHKTSEAAALPRFRLADPAATAGGR